MITKIIISLVGISALLATYLYLEKPCHLIQAQRDNVMCLLNNGKFYDVEKYFSELQIRYSSNEITEEDVWDAFIVFESSDLNIKLSLEQWLLEYPESFAANLALGTLNEHLGWLSRGSKWSKDTPKDQLENMSSYFDVAEKYFIQAIKNNQESTLPYVGLIRMYRTSDRDKMKESMIKGLQVDPSSYRIRYYYLFGLQPKWGGTNEDLKEFFEETLGYSDENPRLKSLEGFLYYVVGDIKSYYDDDIKNQVIACKTAKSNLDGALDLSVHPLFYSRRGHNNICLKEYNDAIADFSLAIQLKPENVQYRRDRGYAYGKIKKYKLAIADLDWAIQRDPLDPQALVYRARIYAQMKDSEKALQDFKASIYFNKSNAIVHRDIGNLHYFQTKNYRQSIEYLSKAIKFGDDDPLVYLLLSMSQYGVFDCGFIENTKAYLKRCKALSNCKDDHLGWVSQSVAAVKANSMCL